MRIYGVGKGIAAMIVILLERCDLTHFHDTYNINVKPDIHVQRVLYRLGLSEEMSEKAAISAARRLRPEYPGEFDSPLWRIERIGVSQGNLIVADAPLSNLCPKRI